MLDQKDKATIGFIRELFGNFRAIMSSKAFVAASVAASLAASVSGALYYCDVILEYRFISHTVPSDTVFSTVMMFASLVAAFRTSHALERYTDAGGYLHKLNACWFDAASTLIAYCRAASAPDEDVKDFQLTVVRLISLMSAMSLNSLQGKDVFNGDYTEHLEILVPDGLSEETKEVILEADAKVECIFQMVQQLVVDAIDTGVMSIAPPILTRTFQDLAAGLQTYHEAKKLAEVPLPFAYVFVTALILLFVTAYVPFMMVLHVQGLLSSIVFTWGTLFMLWYLNCVAESLSNPFAKESRTLNPTHIQKRLNDHLQQLLRQAHMPTPSLSDRSLQSVMQNGNPEMKAARSSLKTWVGAVGAPTMQMHVEAKPSPALLRYRAGGWEEVPQAPPLKVLRRASIYADPGSSSPRGSEGVGVPLCKVEGSARSGAAFEGSTPTAANDSTEFYRSWNSNSSFGLDGSVEGRAKAEAVGGSGGSGGSGGKGQGKRGSSDGGLDDSTRVVVI